MIPVRACSIQLTKYFIFTVWRASVLDAARRFQLFTRECPNTFPGSRTSFGLDKVCLSLSHSTSLSKPSECNKISLQMVVVPKAQSWLCDPRIRFINTNFSFAGELSSMKLMLWKFTQRHSHNAFSFKHKNRELIPPCIWFASRLAYGWRMGEDISFLMSEFYSKLKNRIFNQIICKSFAGLAWGENVAAIRDSGAEFSVNVELSVVNVNRWTMRRWIKRDAREHAVVLKLLH